jgi:hypothetical protein
MEDQGMTLEIRFPIQGFINWIRMYRSTRYYLLEKYLRIFDYCSILFLYCLYFRHKEIVQDRKRFFVLI